MTGKRNQIAIIDVRVPKLGKTLGFTWNGFDSCWGLVRRIPRVAGYGPKFWIRQVPSSSKRLQNHTPHVRYGPTTPNWRGGATNLKRTKPKSNPWHHFPSFMIVVDRQDFATCLPVPPPSLTWDGHERPINLPGGFQYRIGSTDTGVSGSGSIYCLLRQDVATWVHACLAAGTRALESISPSSDIATRPRIHT
jgi:hypothetical protein